MVELGGAVIDDDELGTRAHGILGHERCGIDRESRPDDDTQITCARTPLGLGGLLQRHRLTEEDGVGLQDAAALSALRHLDTSLDPAPHLLEGMTHAAIDALHPLHVAVKLKNSFFRAPRLLMKPVDVLGYDAVQLAELFQLGDGVVGAVGLDVAKGEARRRVQLPDSLPRFPITDELLVGEIVGIDLRPQAIGASEVGDSRLGADPGAGKHHDPFGSYDEVRNLLDALSERLLVHLRPTSLVFRPA